MQQQQQKAQLFRKAALEKLSTPEQLDVLMQVTTPTGWLALGAFGVALVLAVLWGIYGTIATRVDGRGILLRGEAVLAVTSSSAGRLTRILVEPGEIVAEGQVVAEVDQSDLEMRLESTHGLLHELEGQNVSQTRMEDENLALSLAALDEEDASQDTAIADARSLVAELEKKVDVQAELVDKGLLTENTLLGTRQQLTSARQSITRAEVRQAQIASERTTLERQIQTQRTARHNRIDQVRRQLDEEKMQLVGSTRVRSPYAGRVLEQMADAGNLVGVGTQLLTLEALELSIESVLYMPSGDGKKIEPGMEVRISPSTVKVEEYGYMIGRVKTVSEFPVTPEGLRRVLRNETLLKELAGQSAPIEVVAELVADPETTSGYRWSSSSGPPTQVQSGTLCSGSVVVESRHPIEFVLPKLKQALGAGGGV